MPKRDDVFPSKYLKASDLKGKPITVTIERAPIETLKSPDGKEETKTVLYFVGAKKTLPLNRTNWDSVAEITGEDDSDNWPGHKLELYPSTVEMKSKVVDCIRVRAPAQLELKKSKLPTKAAPKQTLAQEMSDEIPW
jgi:hypothetical protein